MLSSFDSRDNCSRRAVLTAGGLGTGGLTLAHLLSARALAGTGSRPVTTGRSVVFLLQHGGPTQYETFDPKTDVPEEIRTVGGTIQTSLPGVAFGSTLRRMATHAQRLAIVRSYSTGSASHSIRPLISEASRQANIGSLYSRLAGASHATTGIPTNVTLFPDSVNPDALGPDLRFGRFNQTGEISSAYAPFAPGSGSNLQSNMQLVLPADRFDERCVLLSGLDRLRRRIDQSGMMEGLDRYRQQAFEMVIRGIAEAFDLSKEAPSTIARYDTGQYVREKNYADKTNGRKSRRWYQNNALTLGRQLLLARRLCEAGCGFVTVATRFVWDMHGDANNLGVSRGMEAVGQPFDHAVSAFIEDCEARGLSDRILLVCAGEMGRTPRINTRGGRDHWARLAPLMLYGGGISAGQIIGQSTRDGGEPLTDAVHSGQLVSTILRTLLDVPELRLKSGLPADLVRFVTSSEPIPRLFS